ncbi:MAG: acetylxylan esterase [Prevotellaceae bacterium]|jgi:dienelactone hydrolase|nr:acetylxylan esterase [Prevotellaceae bacterium]
MKKLLLILCYLFFTLCLTAQNESLNRYLLNIMHREYAERKLRLADALKSRDSFVDYQQDCKQQYLRLLADIPKNIRQRIPEADTVGTIAGNGFDIQKIILAKRISTNLYLPRATGAKPAVLFLCGHEQTGKAAESYQKTAASLAQNGFVVLVVDPTGQGERVQLIDSTGQSLTRRATTEHTLLNTGAMLVDWSVADEELIDNIVCMNFLCSLNGVDKTRIGCMGNSGGGTQATYFSAIDSRVKAVACCSYFTQRERMFALNGPDDGCQYLAGEGRAQLEIADYYLMQAPRPVLILAGKRDFIDYKGCENAFDELRKAYQLLEKTDNAKLFSVDDGHGISAPKREAAVQFFKKHLKNDLSTLSTGDAPVLPDSLLLCTRTGQMKTDFPEEKLLQQRLFAMTEHYLPYRQSFREFFAPDSCRKIVRQLLNIPAEPNATIIHIEKTDKKELFKAEYFNLQKKDIVNSPNIPVVMLSPTQKLNEQAQIFIVLNDSGMSRSFNMPEVESLLANGHFVVLADLRGMGVNRDLKEKNNSKFQNDDYRNAALSLFVGRPLLGQRVEDIFSVLDLIQKHKNLAGFPVSCLTFGNIGLAALHAAYLDSRIQSVDTRNCLGSWVQLIADPLTPNRLNTVVPKALKYYDIRFLRE